MMAMGGVFQAGRNYNNGYGQEYGEVMGYPSDAVDGAGGWPETSTEPAPPPPDNDNTVSAVAAAPSHTATASPTGSVEHPTRPLLQPIEVVDDVAWSSSPTGAAASPVPVIATGRSTSQWLTPERYSYEQLDAIDFLSQPWQPPKMELVRTCDVFQLVCTDGNGRWRALTGGGAN